MAMSKKQVILFHLHCWSLVIMKAKRNIS